MSVEIEELKMLKKNILSCVKNQDLKDADTEEMGDAIDMIKDLSEAIYYCTIAEGMEKGTEENEAMEKAMMKLNMDKNGNRDNYYYPMYYTTRRENDWNRGRLYHWGYPDYEEYPYDYPSKYAPSTYTGGRVNTGMNNNMNAGMNNRDSREGRSGQARRMYVESKEMNQDENTQMVKLKEYIDDLTDDMTEIAKQMSPEHKTMLQQNIAKISNLIGQMK